MRITVSGLPGSGTTSLARHLATAHCFSLISAGEVFRQMAAEQGMDLAEFGRFAESNPAIDREIDARQKEIAEQRDDIVVEGRLSGWFVQNADLKVWLFAPIDCRVSRILDRDAVESMETARALTLEREASEAHRYREYYNIDIDDPSPYHLAINSGRFGVVDLASIVDTAILVIREKKGN
jgi:cytidylate kinase